MYLVNMSDVSAALQVGPWSRMKRKTVGGVVPDNIPAAQRARTEAAIKV